MTNKILQKYLPYMIAVIVFVLMSIIFLKPIFEGKAIRQSDVVNHKGMAKEIRDHRAQYGEEPLWSNSMFGGMPSYQTSVVYKGNLISKIDKVLQLGLPHPVGNLFLLFLGFFILLLILNVNPWLAIAGSIVYAFSSYFIIIMEAGHNSKLHALAYMAPVLAGIILCLKEKYIIGGLLTALFVSLEISANHLQITYYLFLTIIVLLIVEAVYAIIEKNIKSYLKALGVLAIAAILAVLPNINNLLITYDYSKYTTRGKSELTFDKDNKTSGLDKDYATQWSYGKAETFSLMIPNIKGGVSEPLANNKTAMQVTEPAFRKAIAESQISHYWGEQPFTSGPVYVGAFVVFLFVLGLFIINGKYKWFLLFATLMSILLAWGRNFMGLTDFFMDFVPGYNKFRAVSMILVIAELCIPILAILTLKKIFLEPSIIKQKIKWFYTSLAITAGLSILFWLLPTTFFTFFSDAELEQFASLSGQGYNEFIDAIQNARVVIFKADAMRSFLFIIIGAVLIYIYSNFKFPKTVFLIVLPILFVADLMPVAKRYLNEDNFVKKTFMEKPFPMSTADKAILTDKEPNYRVYNMAVNTFNDASTSYYHKSIGGYHGAKLKRYQEFIEYVLTPEMQKFHSVLSNKPTDSSINAVLSELHGINMLNTKYIIYNRDAPPLQNRHSYGSAWFVDNVKIVPNADEEIIELSAINNANIAVVDKRYIDLFAGFKGETDSLAKIKLISYKANHLEYSVENLNQPQIAIFSEIYYEKGWNAYVDGKLMPHFRTNYILRGMLVPSGAKQIVFKFEPKLFYTGEKISFAGSILLYVVIFGALAYNFYRKRKNG